MYISERLKDSFNFSSVRTPYQLIALVAAGLGVYYPVMFGEFSYIDDWGIVEHLSGLKNWSLLEYFLPGRGGGLYYRPVIALSFLIDKYVWNLDAGLMHLENVILHVINGILVFWLARRLTSRNGSDNTLLPLIAALVFALHPVNSEAVNWISARTDVLACTFILISAIFLIVYSEKRDYRFLALSGFSMVFGFLSKEIALGFLPGVLLFLRAQRDSTADRSVEHRSPPARKPLPAWLPLALVGLTVILYLMMRKFAFTSQDGRISFTLKVMFMDIPYTGFAFLKAFVFYIKKFFLPFPLNLAILEVDPLYEFLAVPVVFGCIYVISKRSVTAAIFSMGIFMLGPALLMSLNQIAWTPYAERYLYLPLAFITIASILFLSDSLKRFNMPQIYKFVLVGLLLVVFAVSTFHRSFQWMSNYAIMKDTVEKNPRFHLAHAEYARALMFRGEFEKARFHYERAREEFSAKVPRPVSSKFYMNRLGYWQVPDTGIAYSFELEGKLDAAVSAYEKVFSSSNEPSEKVLARIVSLYTVMLSREKKPQTVRRINKKLSMYAEQLNNKKGSPDVFYRVGKAYLAKGEQNRALRYFKMAYPRFKNGDMYLNYTGKLMKRIEKN